jgi:2-hydroxychromene-2-carboxylate isomerase
LWLPKLRSNQPVVEVYLALNDPHSFMLVQVLPELADRFSVKFDLFLIYENVPGVTIDPKLMRQWALKDANYIATQYSLTHVDKLPNSRALLTGQQLWQLTPKTLANAVDIFQKTWFDQFDDYYDASTPVINFQIKNQQRLIHKGHYLPAAMLFAGNWFIGIDRLAHLERQLNTLKLNKSTKANKNDDVKFDVNALVFEPKRKMKSKDECQVYISLRSPYSYLGFIKAKRLAQHYHMPLKIRPLVPLMMRGFHLTSNKQKYIIDDATREAQQANIPFSATTCLTEQGIINCYQVFAYAEHQGKAIDYIEAVFEAIYVNNIDLALLVNLKDICRILELDYQQALVYGESHDWQQWSDVNQTALDKIGLWGVPCFSYQDTHCWGQDRLAQIEQAIISS